jgi:hypothetical protein
MAWAAAVGVMVMGSVIGHGQMKSPAARQPVQAWVKSSTGLDLHGACALCHFE